VRIKLARWRWIAVLGVFTLVAAACAQPGTEETTTTQAEAAGTTTTTTASPTTEPAPTGYTLTVAIFSDPTTDNPWAAFDTESDVWTGYVNPGQGSLYGYQFPTYTLAPTLAADPEPPTVQPDGDMWSVTVNLRDDVTWSDGTPMTADDVVFTFETIKKYDGLGGNFPAAWPLAREDDPATEEDESADGVVSVEALSPTQVKITFNFDPGLAIWPFSVAVAPIYQKAFWGPKVDASPDSETFYAESGLGAPNATAYNSSEREPGAFWRNVAIDDYWDQGSRYTVYENGAFTVERNGTTETYGGEPSGDVVADYVEGPYASEIVYSLYSDQNSAVLALTDGEVDFLLNPLGLQRGLQQLVLSEPELNVIVNEQNGFRYLAFNVRKFPMNDLAFRQALACRIDKEFMANTVLGGAAIAANSLVPPGNSFWANPDLQETCAGMSEQERLEKAVQILKDAGWTWTQEPVWDEANRDVIPKGEGLRGPNGETVPELTLLAPGPGYDPLRATYSLFIEGWAEDLGIPLRAEPTGFSVIVDKVFEPSAVEEWDMYILGWGLGIFPDHVFDFFKSSADTAVGGFNTPGYSDPEFDALAEQFDRAKTLEEARDLVKQADAMIAEDLPYVVLFTTPIIEAYRNTIEFPATTTLDGVQNWFGGVGIVSATKQAS